MSYLVLARKYRPATFSEVVGQEHVTRTLGNAFATNRVHHAFLFCGPRGCGKTTLARIVGKALNCTKSKDGPSGEPCGKCDACLSIANGSSVDYQEMDGASNRGIDAIRELTEAVRYQPAVLRKKVYVIDEVHMLTTEAFNALLKTLEEPPPHVTFVLATTEPHKLPNTILSRCQRYDFKLVPASRLAQHLASIFKTEKLKIEAGAISLIVRESGGSVRDALSLCDQIISYVGEATITEAHVAEVLGVADRSLTRTLVTSLATGDAGAALGAVESAIERGVDEVQLARAIVRYLRDLAVLQVAPNRTELVDASDEERAELVAEAKQIDRSRVAQMFDRMLRCCDELGKTLQPRLVLDCALIDVATIEPLVPLGDLLDRLGDLEARVAGKGGSRPTPPPSGPGGSGGGSRPQPKTTVPSTPAGKSGPGSLASLGPVAREPLSSPNPNPPNAGGRGPGVRADDDSHASQASAPPRSSYTAQSAPVSVSSHTRSSASPGFAGAKGGAESSASPGFAGARSGARGGGESIDSGPVIAVHDAAPSGPSTKSSPVSMQPSGPVPKADAVATGSGPQPIALPQTAAEALGAWGQVIDYLETQRKISLRGYYEFARVLKWTATELDLGFAPDDDSRWAGENAIETRNVEELRGLLADLGHKVKLTVRMLDAAESKNLSSRSIVESTRESKYVERTKREKEAREHPITKHVLQTFGAAIKEIKTDV